jgi:two-component system, OmpR family, sensor histidine kinase ArlS
LFISRIENDQFPKADTFAVYTLLEEVMEELHHRLADKDLQYTVNISRNAILRGQNHDLIFQLIYNLLNNAIRYNREGGAIIVSDVYKAGEPYRLLLRDTGIGIPEQEQTHIFNRFKKVEKSGNEGYGLGLSIVSTIARYHNIELEVSSKVGEGSVFTLIFPEEALV